MSKRLPPGEGIPYEAQPDLLHYRPVSNGDLSLVRDLSLRLKKSGALDKDEAARGMAADDFQEIFAEAAAAGRAEDELNPDFYRPEVEAIVSAREASEPDWANPSLDGIDDYGVQVYPDGESLTRAHRAKLQAEEEEEAPWERLMASERNSEQF